MPIHKIDEPRPPHGYDYTKCGIWRVISMLVTNSWSKTTCKNCLRTRGRKWEIN